MTQIMVATAASISHVSKDQLDMFRVYATDQYKVLLLSNASMVIYPKNPHDFVAMKSIIDQKLVDRFQVHDVEEAEILNMARSTISVDEFYKQVYELVQ